MKTGYPIKDIFSIALSGEAKARTLYEEFGRIFSHVPEAAGLWKAMAEDEARHEKRLLAMYDAIPEGKRDDIVQNPMVERTEKLVLGLSVAGIVGSVVCLDDAYEIAYALEHSEINAVLNFILNELVPSVSRHAFTASIVGEHLDRLDAFAHSVFDAPGRRAIMAVK